ncbi:YceI family protein [Caulobacter hibisci]|uniref:YceI family protein n=1 Tax=Caulobacter hibisci TaxID=2035993 RepID=A0ABS0T5G4_9CAUL|nr:YceI family protein [Caulobacter hibisci]MBI1686143.1 YceI family protein [Caulobacter hibisci]
MARPFAYAILAGALLAAPFAAPAVALAQPATDPAAAPKGDWALDKRHASLTLRVKHFGTSNYTFRLSGLDGAYSFDPAKPLDTKVSIAVDPKSVDTGLPNFNKEISDDPKFFDSTKYPTITFVSTKLDQTAPGKGKLTGDLTFRGVTKPVTLDVTYNGFAKTPFGSQIMGFSATGKIKRSEFGFTHLVPLVSDDVDLAIEAEFNPKK